MTLCWDFLFQPMDFLFEPMATGGAESERYDKCMMYYLFNWKYGDSFRQATSGVMVNLGATRTYYLLLLLLLHHLAYSHNYNIYTPKSIIIFFSKLYKLSSVLYFANRPGSTAICAARLFIYLR